MDDVLRFDDRVAIVTGAGRGLGRAHAVALAGRGAAVVVNDLPTDAGIAAAAEVVELVRRGGGRAIAVNADISVPSAAEEVVETAVAQFGQCDILVNNAGVTMGGRFADLSPADFRRVIDVNLLGTVWMTKAVWSLMAERRYGRIVNTASMAGYLGVSRDANYAAAKAGVIGLTRSLALEVGDSGVRVNALAPGAATEMTHGHFGPRMAEALDPANVSPVVLLLAHERCPVNGETIHASGGRTALVFTAQTRGRFSGSPTAEELAERWEEVADISDYEFPRTVMEELRLLARHLPPEAQDEFNNRYNPGHPRSRVL